MNYLRKRFISFVMAVVLFISVISFTNPKTAMAAENVTRAKFIELVVKEIGLTVDKREALPYIAAALKEGIITKTTFGKEQDYNGALTKSDAAVILVRADEYLNGVTVSDELIQTIIAKRISDIGKVSDARKPFVAKAFAMGYLSGASNGAYSANRKLAPSGKMSLATAKTLVARIKDKSKRVPMSPDGQVLRTTKLPSNADKFPYILASYPNAYYDWDFDYMRWYRFGQNLYLTGEYVNLEDYAAPVDVSRYKDGLYWEKHKQIIGEAEEVVKAYMMTLFNVDYRTIKKDTKWQEKMKQFYQNNLDWAGETFAKRMDGYIERITVNKTVIECDMVALDTSSYYISKGNKFLRVYIHYRINSAVEMEKIYNAAGWSTLFLLSPFYSIDSNLANVKLGQWREGYFDVEFYYNEKLKEIEIHGPYISDWLHSNNLEK